MQQTILAIDDLMESHLMLEMCLKPEGWDIHRALDASDGLHKARTLQPDLIILDLNMPEVDGFELCQRLQADPHTALIPIIFLTAEDDITTKVKGLDLGAVDYVTKPFNAAELRARFRAVLRTKRYQDLLTTHAQVDTLTGLWNRAYFNQQLSKIIPAARYSGHRVCIALLDLDHFKKINDTYGHLFGDRVLQVVSESLVASLRSSDIACRYGGEEFVIILNKASLHGGLAAAQRMRERLATLNLRPKGERVPITASFGVVSTDQFLDPVQLTTAELIDAADKALYMAKYAGRDRVCVAAPPCELQTQPKVLTQERPKGPPWTGAAESI